MLIKIDLRREFNHDLSIEWPRGGMVTQRIANPFIPVRFGRASKNVLFYLNKNVC